VPVVALYSVAVGAVLIVMGVVSRRFPTRCDVVGAGCATAAHR